MSIGAFVLAARLVLAAVFLTAGAGKLADLAGSREAVAAFGVPQRLARTVGLLLPLAELALAVVLIPVAAAPVAAIAAVVLLLAFSAGIANAMAHGREPDCHCFGQIHSAPAGPATLARNLVLAAVAAFVAVAGASHEGPSATHWLTRLPAAALVGVIAGLVIAGLIGFVVWFALALLAQNGRIAQRLETLEQSIAGLGGAPVPLADPLASLGDAGLAPGTPAPPFMAPALDGAPITLEALLAPGLPLLLVFSDAGCGPCNALMPDVAFWQHAHGERLTIAVLAAGDADANRAKGAEHGLDPMLLMDGTAVSDAYRVNGTPGAVLLDPAGRIASPVAAGADAIGVLLEYALRTAPSPAGGPAPGGGPAPAGAPGPAGVPAPALGPGGLAIHHVGHNGGSGPGRPAPALQLPDLDGTPIALQDVYGDRTLALFWNPDCGFCQRMLPALRDLEARPGPRIVVISSGDADRNRAEGLRSLMLLDDAGVAQEAFGADGTPMAVLIEDGRIASHVAAGADAVLALAATPAGR